MLLPLSIRRAARCLCWGLFLAAASAAFAQTNYYAVNGTEYAPVESLPGEQIWPDVAASPGGGFVVWQDNATDGSGWGIRAQRLDGTLSGTLSPFKVNARGTNDQENPRVAMLRDGGAVFVWQGGKPGGQHIYARFLTASNLWLTDDDVLVSTPSTNVFYTTNTATVTTTLITTNWDILHLRILSYTTNTSTTVVTTITTNASDAGLQINPAVATLNNSNTIVVWAAYNSAGLTSMQDVYGQMLSPAGQKVGTNFLINQFVTYNQRSPAVAALKDGGFVVVWVSEQERSTAPNWGTNTAYYSAGDVPLPSVDIFARRYNGVGVAQGGEFLVNTNANPCANPVVAAATDGSFMVAWSASDISNPTNSWDVYARPFSSANVGGTVLPVNTRVYGDEYAPQISAIGQDYLVVWTSLGQDGSREGVYGQFVHNNGSRVGGEFCVNTTTYGQQMQPAVASDGVSQFLAVWTGFTFSAASMDLFAQRYVNVAAILAAIDAIYVHAPFALSNSVYQPQLQVTWPSLLGISVSNYEVYVDGSSSPMALSASNGWTMTAADGLTTNSTHSFQVDYVTADGRRSPRSPSVSGTTWSGLNYYGIPYEWMAAYFGGYYNGTYHTNYWPSVNAPLVSGGPTLMQVFLSGGNPLDPGTWLVSALAKTAQGLFLSWNTQPGFTYQVQTTANLTDWSNLGSVRFAAGTNDSIYVGGSSAGYYRILLVR
jgi:hypothetical protein